MPETLAGGLSLRVLPFSTSDCYSLHAAAKKTGVSVVTDQKRVAMVKLFRIEPNTQIVFELSADDLDSAGGETLVLQRQSMPRKGQLPEVRELEVGSAVLYASSSITVGRREDCDLVPLLSNGANDPSVSRVHCVVSASRNDSGNMVVTIDAQSANGMYKDDYRRVEGESIPFEEDVSYAFGTNLYDSKAKAPPRRFLIRCEIQHS